MNERNMLAEAEAFSVAPVWQRELIEYCGSYKKIINNNKNVFIGIFSTVFDFLAALIGPQGGSSSSCGPV